LYTEAVVNEPPEVCEILITSPTGDVCRVAIVGKPGWQSQPVEHRLFGEQIDPGAD
jgi:hypothetical protein